jgi:glutathione-regulated potassium-efflux system ancillary protein KefC
MSARSVLELLSLEPHAARKLAWRFRQHNIEQLERTVPLHKDQNALIAAAKQGRQQLEALFAQEREQAQQRRQHRRQQDWGDAERD